MQSLFRLLSVIALSAVMIAPAAAFQDCCCVRRIRLANSDPVARERSGWQKLHLNLSRMYLRRAEGGIGARV